MNKESELIEFIAQDLLRGRPDVSIDAEDDILGSGLVDSLGVMRIVAFIEKRYEVKVPPEDVRIEHFLSVNHIVSYLETRRDGAATDA